MASIVENASKLKAKNIKKWKTILKLKREIEDL